MPIITRGCGRWGAARYGAVLAVEPFHLYTRINQSASRNSDN